MNELIERQFDYKPKIAVIGDSILDEHYDVDVTRISPEFPVPVFHSQNFIPTNLTLGGAANVCAQFSNFNFDVDLFSVVNSKIKEINKFTNLNGCVISENISVKKRFYSNEFPLCRIDVEDKIVDKKARDKVIENFKNNFNYDVVIFSDYNKGFFNEFDQIIEDLPNSPITIVDPKKSPIDRWIGCSIIKPNSQEAKDISGETDAKKQCEYFIKKTNCQAVIITDGKNGIVGNVMNRWFEYKPTIIKQPRSVVGAGDCFVSFLAMCMAHSIDIKRAVEIAFEACSFYIDKPYNTPIYPYQISSKFISPRNLTKRDFSLVFTNGCFDILHPGHVKLLQFAKTKADKLVVALNSDESVKNQRKSHPLINNLDYRKLMISSLECVDFVLDFAEDTPYELIKTIKPDVLVKGSDWSNPVGSDIVPECFSFSIFENYSTSSIIEKIKKISYINT